MADVSHELGALRHIVDSPLSSKVAMFNKVADQHNSSQLLNPFSNVRGSSPGRPVFSKDEYGKPLAGSLTEMRGQKANIHVCKEMLELCQIIDSEGFSHPENENLKVIFFGDLFNIYNHISDKCVGLLLRARKHKLVEFEGEMLFQRRDDEVPIITTKPIIEIRRYLEAKQEEFRRSVSPAPKATTIIQDNNMRRAVSQTPSSSPLASKVGTPRNLSPQTTTPDSKDEIEITTKIVKPEPTLRHVQSTPEIKINISNEKVEINAPVPEEAIEPNENSNSEKVSSVKIAVYTIKAPTIETSEIIENKDDVNQGISDEISNASNGNIKLVEEIEQKIEQNEQIESKIDNNITSDNKILPTEENEKIESKIDNNITSDNKILATEENEKITEVSNVTDSQIEIKAENNDSEVNHISNSPIENNISENLANTTMLIPQQTESPHSEEIIQVEKSSVQLEEKSETLKTIDNQIPSEEQRLKQDSQ